MEYESISKGTIIQYSAILFIIGSAMAYFIGSSIMELSEVYMSTMYFVGMIILVIVHELSHYIGFLTFGNLKPSEIKLVRNNANEIPCFVPKVQISENAYVYIRLLPAITCTTCAVMIMYGAGNLGLSGLVGVGLGMSGGDLHMVRISRRTT